MDLIAYSQIEDLDVIAEQNGIDIPRLRGYRLMKNENPVSKEEIKEMMQECEVDVGRNLCEAYPYWSPNPKYRMCSDYTDFIKDFYLILNPDKDKRVGEKYISIRWDRIHGWKRKILKFEIKKRKRKIKKQYDMWNKYAGKENVLYIHARLGGYNWNGHENLTKESWFLDRVDDSFDNSYCDIYAKID